ncbi:MAG TPA: sugar phosphate nucleotidyltransferase [Opitutaceae bacterium]|nr:sugar phosphate nucleotidyltransferase [Opitutaceae bacterium]
MPTLLVLAAGLGSRYGGLKQIDPVGPSGETLLDYGVYDAHRAGFGRVVFVIRRDFEEVFREKVAAKYERSMEVGMVYQSLDDLPGPFRDARPAGREKPWGTGHAVWCARQAVRENFAVVNADDYYGPDAFAKLAAFLREARAAPAPFCLVGFRLADTLSEHGAVSRGICEAEGGWLKSVVEQPAIRPSEVGPGRRYSGEETASMNCWGFTPALFPLLEERLEAFLAGRLQDPKAELYLPGSVSELVQAGRARVAVLAAAGSWFGVTYREDRPRVAAAIAGLVRRGAYPARLF